MYKMGDGMLPDGTLTPEMKRGPCLSKPESSLFRSAFLFGCSGLPWAFLVLLRFPFPPRPISKPPDVSISQHGRTGSLGGCWVWTRVLRSGEGRGGRYPQTRCLVRVEHKAEESHCPGSTPGPAGHCCASLSKRPDPPEPDFCICARRL